MSRLYVDVTAIEAEQLEKLLFNRIELAKLLDGITNKSDRITLQVKSAKHQGRVFPVLESVREVMLAAAINEIDSKLALLGINIVDKIVYPK